MIRSSAMRAALVLTMGLTSIGVLALGCSSPSETPAPTTERAPSGPALSFLYTTATDGLVLHDARADTSRTLV
ncbi:MAG TPA: hypothetical protein VJ884_08295, partial [Salinibacter sp.]|nr:hypothetical protein [Salinibacter sp.]